MKYSPTIVDGELLYYEIRNDDGMYIGSAIQNQAPFADCQPVTLEDAEKNARLWAAAPDLLRALESIMFEIDNGRLIRNIDKDHESDWGIKTLSLVHSLSAAVNAINKAKL